MMGKLTVGDIIANTNFDVNANVAIQIPSDDGTEEYAYRGWPSDCPAELLILHASYITVRDGELIIEYEDHEE